MCTSSTSSTDIIVRHTILHFCQESIVYPEKNVPSAKEGSPLPCLPVKKILSISLRDQLTRSIIHNWGDMRKEAPKEDKTQSKSVELCVVPSCFKCSTITPVPKK
ncbi:hypothetical protein AMECASPLE_039021 [Ameca splendens]|uniref:Uncharacterized protein n=1 Tax=Ameca splendens TaxID=208324 RepID=A0ABV0ZHZ8_9TELE